MVEICARLRQQKASLKLGAGWGDVKAFTTGVADAMSADSPAASSPPLPNRRERAMGAFDRHRAIFDARARRGAAILCHWTEQNSVPQSGRLSVREFLEQGHTARMARQHSWAIPFRTIIEGEWGRRRNAGRRPAETNPRGSPAVACCHAADATKP